MLSLSCLASIASRALISPPTVLTLFVSTLHYYCFYTCAFWLWGEVSHDLKRAVSCLRSRCRHVDEQRGHWVWVFLNYSFTVFLKLLSRIRESWFGFSLVTSSLSPPMSSWSLTPHFPCNAAQLSTYPAAFSSTFRPCFWGLIGWPSWPSLDTSFSSVLLPDESSCFVAHLVKLWFLKCGLGLASLSRASFSNLYLQNCFYEAKTKRSLTYLIAVTYLLDCLDAADYGLTMPRLTFSLMSL